MAATTPSRAWACRKQGLAWGRAQVLPDSSSKEAPYPCSSSLFFPRRPTPFTVPWAFSEVMLCQLSARALCDLLYAHSLQGTVYPQFTDEDTETQRG